MIDVWDADKVCELVLLREDFIALHQGLTYTVWHYFTYLSHQIV